MIRYLRGVAAELLTLLVAALLVLIAAPALAARRLIRRSRSRDRPASR